VWEKLVPKHKLFKNTHLHDQGLKCRGSICKLEDHVGEKGLNLNWSMKHGLANKNFLQVFLVAY